MFVRKLFGIVAAAIPLSSCAAPQAAPSPSRCYAFRSGDWRAWVNAMPGPGARPKLIVTGTVETPTGGNRVAFLPALEVAESSPAQVTARIEVKALSDIATQAVTPQAVRGEWAVSQAIGSVTIRCEDDTLAVISPVETAH